MWETLYMTFFLHRRDQADEFKRGRYSGALSMYVMATGHDRLYVMRQLLNAYHELNKAQATANL